LAGVRGHLVNLHLGGPPDYQVEDVQHGRVPGLLGELDVEFRVHHGGEVVEVAVAARCAVAAGRVDLELDARCRVPEGRILLAEFLSNLAQGRTV
jgi:hypothetical protein